LKLKSFKVIEDDIVFVCLDEFDNRKKHDNRNKKNLINLNKNGGNGFVFEFMDLQELCFCVLEIEVTTAAVMAFRLSSVTL
jgi:Cdc6-like AAA superfamily ATPase